MTDIVERLRDPPPMKIVADQLNWKMLMREAADEIERLKALLKAKVTPGYELLADQIEQCGDEIERLRAALDLAYAALRQIADEDIHGDLKDAINKALGGVPQGETP